MNPRWLLLGALALLPMAAAPFASRAVSELAASRLASAAGQLAGLMPSGPDPTQPAPQLPADEPEDELESEAPGPRSKSSRSHRAQGPPRKGIMVRRDVVKAAARAGVRPSGAPVPADDEHPAGLMVQGLGGAGALRDGDVITRVGGIAPRSTEDVIGVVAGAYRNKVYVISGEFWRNGERWNATVELPLPDKP